MNKIFKLSCVIAAVLSLTAGAGAQTYTVLKHFNPNTNPSGIQPRGTLVQAADGTLYGVASTGGAGAAGVVFKVQTNGAGFTVIKNFSLVDVSNGTNSDGANPQAGLLLSGSTLFGTTMNGGTGGRGTVFSLNTNGTSFTVLKNFTALDTNTSTNTDGANPNGALILSGGTLYGTTANGGIGEFGTVFRVNTNGSSFTNLYNFTNGNDGAEPQASLVLSGSTLYGTARYGGNEGAGTVFSVSINGTGFNPIHYFTGSGTDGANPVAGLVLSGGILYGTTQYGDSGDGSDDGTVFAISTTGAGFTNLYSFNDSSGSTPFAELTLSGSTLYGTTGNGGYNFGTVFQINTDGTGFATICNLVPSAGWGPQGGLLLSGGTLYGTTVAGGMPGLGNGVLFSVDVSGSNLTGFYIFAGPSGAADPQTGMALSGNMLFGTTVNGGTNNSGTLFEINTNGSNYAAFLNFSLQDNNGDNSDGANPRGVPVLSGGTFYGTTRYGGTNGQGALYKMNSDGIGFTNIFSFNDPHLVTPITALTVSGTTLYGTTPQGGANYEGSVFRINADGTGFTNIYDFNGSDGFVPTAGLIVSGNTLYGATQSGGTGHGNLFQINTDGTHYTNIYSFTGGSDGANPGTVLVLTNNILYGTAYHGGSNNQGTVFKINTDRTGFTVLHTFGGASPNGAGPDDLLLSGGTLYGTMAFDGSTNQGTVFSLDIVSTNFTVLKNFLGGADGANPTTTLVLSGNVLYGTTQNGGLSGHGTVFSLSLSSSIIPVLLHIRPIANAVVLTWTAPGYSLYAAPLVMGTYTNVPAATSPYTNNINAATKFFRLQEN